MAKAYMERIEALRQQYLNTRVDMDVYNAKYVTEGFKETEGQPWILQKATGYARTCEKKQIYIQDHELLVGGVGFKPRAGILNPDSASGVIEKEVDTISTRPFDPFYLSEEGKKIYLEEVKDYWKNKCVLDRWRLMAPKDMETLRTNGIIFIDRKAVRDDITVVYCDANGIAESIGNPKGANVAILGAVLAVAPVTTVESMMEAIRIELGEKKARFLEGNKKALLAGMEAAK